MRAFLNKINPVNILVFFFLNTFLFPIYPFNLRPTLVVLLLLSSIAYAIKTKIRFNFKLNKENKSFYINTSLFFILGIGLTYTKNFSTGASALFRMLPLLIFPLIFKFINNKKDISDQLILKAYSFFYIAVVVLFFCFFIYFLFNGDITVNYLINYNERINSLLGSYSLHPLYASIYISIALILSINLYNEQVLNRSFLFFLNILLALNLILLARKSAIIIMFIFFVVYQLKFKKNKKAQKIFAVFTVISLAILIFIFVPDISYRFEDFAAIFSNSNFNGSIGLRINIVKCSYSSILQNPIFGYGIGSVKNILYDCYQSFPEVFNSKYYNTHNQYIGVWLYSGVLGFISLITMLGYGFIKSIQARDLISFAILILFSSIMLIEIIFERQDGVFVFTLFINLIAFKNQGKNNNKNA
jgi:O-antigen ligase